MKKIFSEFSKIISTLVAFTLAIWPSLVLAQTQVIPDSLPNGSASLPTSPATIVTFIFRTVIELAGGIFLVLLLFGGVTYMTSAGNEEGTEKGKKIMLNAFIGLIIILAAYAVGTFVLKALGYSF
jgi:hypothetical protein